MNKTDRKRRQARDRMRAMRARRVQAAETARLIQDAIAAAKAEAARAAEADRQRIAAEAAALKRRCAICGQPGASCDIGGILYCADHSKAALEPVTRLPSKTYTPPAEIPLQRPDPLLFDPATDPFRPAWWAEVDPKPQPIALTTDPRRARRSAPIACDGIQTVTVAHDLGITYSEAEGHIDRAAEKLQQAEDEERKQGDHTSWR